MKIKEVQAGVKISRNYDSYSMNLIADLEENESAEKAGEILIEKVLEVVNKKIISKKNSDEKEVGAAWFCRNSKDRLSVQYSKGGEFKDVEIKNLEEFDGGYRQKAKEKVFIFRRIPNENRKNNKMPMFRIYKEVKNE